MLVRVFYVSEVAEPVSDMEIQVILGVAQIRNRRLDVTGMLAQSDGHFAQIIEGRREAVDEVMARVRRDPRHRNIREIVNEPISLRQFSRWAMGLIRRDDMADEMLRLHRDGAADASAVRKIIQRLLVDKPQSTS